MALIPTSLQTQFLGLSSQPPSSAMEAANRIASIYESYAALGMAGGIYPLLAPGPGRATMAAPLIAALSVSPGVPPVVAQAIGSMVTLFWTGAVFISVPPGGIAAPPTALPALITGLTALLSANANPAPVFASQMALLLDTCTRTVLVTVPPIPPAPPVILPVL